MTKTTKTTRRKFMGQCSALAGISLLSNLGFGKESNDEIGSPYPGWHEGEMDIHHINTGLAESSFMIFPDGTSMVIDAGDCGNGNQTVKKFPDTSRRPSEWIARYIMRVNPNKNQIDYFLISHFHADHMGIPEWNVGQAGEENHFYKLSGITHLGEIFHFRKGIDRAFPDYNRPVPYGRTQNRSDAIDNYLKYTAWKTKTDNLQMIPFHVGAKDQITLEKNPARYPTFHTQNLYANGIMWSGHGEETIDYSKKILKDSADYQPPENSLSIALTFSYGPFRYFTAGDFNGKYTDDSGAVHSMEEPLAQVCGAVDVCKANHHCWTDTMTDALLRSLKARVYCVNTWDAAHVAPEAVARIANKNLFNGERLICPTMVPSNYRQKYSVEPYTSLIAQESLDGGHVVIKVFNEGKNYKVYYLSPQNEQMTVLAIYGPFTSQNAEQ